MKKFLALFGLFVGISFGQPPPPPPPPGSGAPAIITASCAAILDNQYSGFLGGLLPTGSGYDKLPCNKQGTFAGGTWAQNTTAISQNGLPLPSSGTLQNLAISFVYSNDGGATNQSFPGFTINFNVYVNGVITSIGCSITVPATSGQSVNGPFKCIDNLHTMLVVTLDLLVIEASTPGTGTFGPSGLSISINASLEKK